MDEPNFGPASPLDRIADAMERTAKANEELIRLATEERDSGESLVGPPLCPHCGMFDPKVRSEGGDGQMSEFALVAACGHCNGMIYAVPQGWLCYATRDDAIEAMKGRTG
jgi:hypothetical protein